MIKTFSKEDTSAIKGIAILLLLNYHNFLKPARYEDYSVSFFPFSENTVLSLTGFGKICVAIFVFLSAYGLTVSLKKYSADMTLNAKKYKDYLLPRLLKLMWGFWFAFVLCVIASAFIKPSLFSNYEFGGGLNGVIRGCLNAVSDFFGLAFLFGSPTLNTTWWYMSLAVFIVLIVPVISALNKRAGALISLLAAVFLPRVILTGSDFDIGNANNLLRYIFIAVLGVIFAQNDLMARMKSYSPTKNRIAGKAIKLLIATALLALCYIAYGALKPLTKYSYEIRDGIIPVFFIYYCYEFITDIPVIHQILVFLGKHSMNIFMIHTFIRAFFFPDFIYSFGNWILIDLALLLFSLAVSIVMELIKKYTGYNRLLNWLINKINNKQIGTVV